MDASQGAEEMLEHLTEKVLYQEEQIQKLEEEKNDLASYITSVSAMRQADHFLLYLYYTEADWTLVNIVSWSLFAVSLSILSSVAFKPVVQVYSPVHGSSCWVKLKHKGQSLNKSDFLYKGNFCTRLVMIMMW